MRVAALYDIHANVPALDTVLAEVEREAPDVILVGGDVAAGPMPADTLDRLRALGDRARFVMGNGDREMVADYDRGPEHDATGAEDPMRRATAWSAAQLDRDGRDFLAAFEPTVTLDVDGLGPVLFCHGSPRSDVEMITALTAEERFAPMVAGVAERVIVCGHTHHQFDRELAGRRIVNAGSVGMPYQGAAAAYWLSLGPGVELRRTDYDVASAVSRLRATGFPDVDEIMLESSLLEPVTAAWVADYFERQAESR